jgi:hypothetical protein
LLVLTTFISSSPGLAMPSTLAPGRLGASSRRVLSREARPPGSGEVTLSQELRTAGLLRPHVLVEYQWSHTGLCPGRKTSHNKYIRSIVSQLPPNRACDFRGTRLSSDPILGGGGKYRFGDSHTSTFPFLPSGSPVPLRPVSGFPGLRLLWGLRHHGTRVL